MYRIALLLHLDSRGSVHPSQQGIPEFQVKVPAMTGIDFEDEIKAALAWSIGGPTTAEVRLVSCSRVPAHKDI